jgi:hypothetical protein
MIAQELAYAAPDRVASMVLQSTAANLVSTLVGPMLFSCIFGCQTH